MTESLMDAINFLHKKVWGSNYLKVFGHMALKELKVEIKYLYLFFGEVVMVMLKFSLRTLLTARTLINLE